MKQISIPTGKPNEKKLLTFGFHKTEKGFLYETTLNEVNMRMRVLVGKEVFTELIDLDTEEEYVSHRIEEATGEFVGQVRSAHDEILHKIKENCFDFTIFQEKQSNELIRYVREIYGDEPEYLWEKYPQNAVWRRKDNQKWYGAILTAKGKTIGLDTDDMVEVIDLRIDPIELDLIVDNKLYFRGYHMNKKHWFTMCLDGSISMEELKERIEESYHLAKK